MPCLVGCVNDYSCTGRIIKPIDGDSIAPYAKLFFVEHKGNGPMPNPEITVGNQSAPQWNNTAIIKSLQVGMSNGVGAKIEILDEEGGSFHRFVDKLNKCMSKGKTEYKMGIEWGWIVTNCDGSNKIDRSPPVIMLPQHLEVNFAEGKIKFMIQGVDLMQHVFAARHDEIHGSDDLKMPLKMAIKQLAQTTDPKFDVDFVRIEKNGTKTTYGFAVGGKNGPKDVWDCDGQNKLATIQKWLEPFLTDRNKGIRAVWNPSRFGKPLLELIEDVEPGCGEAKQCTSNLGTYIVNGGPCSPVVSFSPKIDYTAAFAHKTTGGNTGGAGSGKTVEKDKECKVQTKQTGILQSIPISRYAWNVHGPKNATQQTQRAQEGHNKANNLIGGAQAIEAELRVQGDPRREFSSPGLISNTPVSLVVINPFHLFGTGDGCGDWLAQPGCNEALSNKNWMIMGCDHTIKEGSYITTLKLRLAPPGIVSPAGSPFGGPGSNGYVPSNAC